MKIWHDGVIQPGEIWGKAIKDAIHRVDIILLLVSVHSLNSDYFYEEKLQQALERHQKGEVQLIPIIVSPCLWTIDSVIRKLQALPKDGVPIVKWAIADEAYTNIVMEVSRVVREIKGKYERELIPKPNGRLLWTITPAILKANRIPWKW